MSEFQMASQVATEQGEAELRIFNFKTTWSEFQKPSQTATEQGEAELYILNFKTTLSEFQRASQTAAEQGKAELHIFNLHSELRHKLDKGSLLLSRVVPNSCASAPWNTCKVGISDLFINKQFCFYRVFKH